MRKLLLATAAWGILGAAAGRADDKEKPTTYIDLQPKANQKLAEDFDPNTEGNNLAQVPKGEQKLEGVKFKIDESLVQLGSKIKPGKPEKISGIKVDKAFAKLHILQATEFGQSPPGDERHVPDNTIIAQYTLHYEDKSVEVIEVAYGKDVRDWWAFEDPPAVTRGKVAWKGNNDFAMQYGASLRLFMTTWENPKPDKKVVRIDFEKTSETAAAPFVIAMTAEEK